MSQWNEYILSNISQAFYDISSTEMDIANITLLQAEAVLNTLYNGSLGIKNNEMQCVVVWYKAAFQGYTPWIVIPCNQPVKTGGIFCEIHEHPTEKLTAQKPVCPPHWTSIQGSCYRLLTTDLDGQEQMCSADVPFSTQQTKHDSLRYAVSMILENELQKFYPMIHYQDWTDIPFCVRVGKTCRYYKRQISVIPFWVSVHDCSVVKAIRRIIGICPMNSGGYCTINVDLQVHQYCLFLSPYYSTCQNALPTPSSLEMTETDKTRRLLSAYLSKAPVHIQKDIKQSRNNDSNCTKYKMHESGEMHSWTSEASTCNVTYTLCKTTEQSLRLVTGCTDSEYLPRWWPCSLTPRRTG